VPLTFHQSRALVRECSTGKPVKSSPLRMVTAKRYMLQVLGSSGKKPEILVSIGILNGS